MNYLRAVTVMMLLAAGALSAADVSEAQIGTVPCTSATETQFVPSWGKVYVSADQYSRYIVQWMYWHKGSRLEWLWLNPDSTYEPDAFFYNYDGKAYGSAPGGYWASDLPYAYVDTQAGDPPEEKAVTIGSAYGVGLNNERVYYTVTRMYEGGGTSSWIKLSSQRGRRDPQWCLSAYCSFGCDGTNNKRTIPFQSHFSVPGCYQFWYEWDATGQHPCN